MQLLRDRNLNIAILISMFWHLVCIFSIYPILATGYFRKNSTTISFLGSILEKVIAIPEKVLDLNRFTLIQSDLDRDKNIGQMELDLMLPENAAKADDIQAEKEKFALPKDKDSPVALTRHYRNKESLHFYFKDFLVTGEAKHRILLYKPDLSNIPVFLSSFGNGSSYNVSVRFTVSKHGFVERPECLISSGSSEIDRMAIRYVRKWQFVPYYEGEKDGQEGIVQVTFRNI